MASSIYYPQSACTLHNIAQSFCQNPESADDFASQVLRANPQTNSLNTHNAPNRPLVVPNTSLSSSVNLTELLCCRPEEHETLSQLSQQVGGATVMGLANMLWDTRIPDAVGDLNTFGGNGMGAALASSNNVLKAINEYDHALKHYEDLRNHRAAPRMVRAAQARADSAFGKMNQVLQMKSLNYLNTNTFKTRPTTNATGKQVWESIPVRDTSDVQKLAKFAKTARVVGPGFIVLDGYLRANSVYHMHQDNDPRWKREAFVQSVGFVGGIAAGALIGTVIAMSSLGIIIGLVAGGLVALAADQLSRLILENVYDGLIQ
ncbi:hypothetical protein KOI40_02040 [Aestuariicella sp. G3-2]|uniref:hypothetical protein n=1 Tax=Pseudomaricurvus albidus TaxID=2842452 RepID=UPI001C0AA1D4|nr:hypothetical protein [Aestuariicella albida]MBU3068578.1 hypothetical protein [Aestuariicella albida]